MSESEPCDNPECARQLQKAQDEIVGLIATTRSQAAKIGQLRRENGPERWKRHAEWDRALKLFKFWQRETGHTKSKWTVARFRCAIDAGLQDYEDEIIMRAIVGIAKNPYYAGQDWWETLWKPDGIERYANRASDTNWRATLEEYAAEQEKKF